jgi:Transposase DDE domain
MTGGSVSRQSLFERLNAGASAFAKELLQHAMNKQIYKACDARLFSCFNKVLLQDSTTLSLPDKLTEYFPGNICGGIQKAVARIQCILEVKTMSFLHFALSGFTENDQSASCIVKEYINEMDLVIRDLGYFTLGSLKAIADKRAYFLSRLRYGVHIYDEQGNRLQLGKLMNTKSCIDQWVWIGKKQRLPVRLVMIPLPAVKAAERKRKARKDRDKRLNHSKTYYQWLDYVVFITNVNHQLWTTQQVAQAYKVRWQIEIIFKSWKSAFNLQYILQEQYRNEHRIITAILLMLLFICLFMQKIFLYFKAVVEKMNGKIVSLFKLSKYVAVNLYFFFSASRSKLLEQIARHCCYESRSDRTNMTDLIRFFKN